MFLKIHFWSKFPLAYQNPHVIKHVCSTLLQQPLIFPRHIIKPLNASLNQMEPQPQVQRRRPAPCVSNQSSQTPFLLCSVQFPRCHCQGSDESRNGKNAIPHMMDCTAKEETYRKAQAGNVFSIIPCCCSVVNAAGIHFQHLAISWYL